MAKAVLFGLLAIVVFANGAITIGLAAAGYAAVCVGIWAFGRGERKKTWQRNNR